RRTSGNARVLPEGDAGRRGVVLGDSDAPNCAAGTCDLQRGVESLLESDALEDGVRAEAVGELANALDRLVAALTNDVSSAELLPERDPSRIVAEEDDLVGAQPLRSDHAAETHCAVADDCCGLTWRDLGCDGSVVACTHHVRECEQRRHQLVVLVDGQHDKGAVRLRNTHRLALAAVDVVEPVPAAVEALAL